jgi:hypothetical protein
VLISWGQFPKPLSVTNYVFIPFTLCLLNTTKNVW